MKTTATETGFKLRSSVWSTKNGRYVLGGTSEVSARALEWWDRRRVAKDVSDLVYALEEQYVGKLWLLANTIYGDPELEWVILEYNDILDPEIELVKGMRLLLPTPEKVNSVYRKDTSPGGIPSTRT